MEPSGQGRRAARTTGRVGQLRDTLFRQAERGLYRALWSDDILDEPRRNLVEDGFGVDSVDRLLTEMRRAFPDAEIGGYRSLIDGLTCEPKDRHVLAAAVRADAAAIVTFNIRDFPAMSVDPFEIDVIDPDTFLLDQLDLAPSAVIDELRKLPPTSENRRLCRASWTRWFGPALHLSPTRFAGELSEPGTERATGFVRDRGDHIAADAMSWTSLPMEWCTFAASWSGHGAAVDERFAAL